MGWDGMGSGKGRDRKGRNRMRWDGIEENVFSIMRHSFFS